MALVRNVSEHTITLTVGTLGPREERSIDVTGANEISLLAQGVLLLLDGSASPPAPAEPFAGRARRTFVASTQPSNLLPGDLWFKTSATTGAVLDVLEMT